MWWARSGRDLWFLRREGWDNELSAFYRWRVGSTRVVRSYATADVVQNCVTAVTRLACTFETSTTPPRIILFDPANGSRRTLFDPNPDFAKLRLGLVQRLRVRNDRGLEAWADLVLPPGYRKPAKLPLIVVQYHSRGFLRGGTGNEYPIFPLAARGFAILSFERPPAVAMDDPTLRTDEELNAALVRNWGERRSLLSAINTAVDAAIATGMVDSQRIGITGLSDGATSTEFALINSHRFAAAAASSCCLEPKTVMTYGGIAWARFNRAVGYPRAREAADDFWRPASIVRNASRIHTPLLLQMADDEYLLSLEAVTALREHGAPVELYVFPDEHHIKWQPRHKLAVFERTADWFGYWLQCREDPAPKKSAQYAQWRAMKIGGDQPQCRRPLMPLRAPMRPHQ
jgi:dipeptidyl aminopeptidase/acylaminoacyl peptidase